MHPAEERPPEKDSREAPRRAAQKRQLLLVLFAALFALCWGVPKALYSRDFGIIWLIFVAGVCGAWLVVRPKMPRNSKK
ncbi:MAG: hypothetical protein J6P53_03760 [Mailhella sp.]|nr:hypothetical protein [Mailhella sp.]